MLPSRFKPVINSFSLLMFVSVAYAQSEKPLKQWLFEKVFGSAVNFNPEMRAKVLGDTPGKRHYVDSNQDGKPEEV